jgi:recombination protein RecA
MSSVPISASYAPFLPTGFEDKKAAVLRHIAGSERLGAVRTASRLEVRPQPEMLSTGVAAVDAITGGGLPRGCLSEICGSTSSGKTSLLLATMAAATRRDETCVLIDASDSFDPASGAAAGLDFSKFLWIRCGRPWQSSAAKTFNHRGHRGSQSLKDGEQNLEQVLKTTDLILQSGGFGLVVLDLAGIPDQFSRRIPLASWFRFQRVVEPAKTALLVVSESPHTQSCATLVIKLCNQLSDVSHPLSGKPSPTRILESMQLQAEITRSRTERKPMHSVTAEFKTQAVRAG